MLCAAITETTTADIPLGAIAAGVVSVGGVVLTWWSAGQRKRQDEHDKAVAEALNSRFTLVDRDMGELRRDIKRLEGKP